MDQSNTESRVRAIISVAIAEVLAINDARSPKHVHSCGRP